MQLKWSVALVWWVQLECEENSLVGSYLLSTKTKQNQLVILHTDGGERREGGAYFHKFRIGGLFKDAANEN